MDVSNIDCVGAGALDMCDVGSGTLRTVVCAAEDMTSSPRYVTTSPDWGASPSVSSCEHVSDAYAAEPMKIPMLSPTTALQPAVPPGVWVSPMSLLPAPTQLPCGLDT